MEGRPFKLLAITIKSDREKVIEFARDRDINYTVLLDNQKVENAYRAFTIPMTILLDKDGNEVLRTRGYTKGAILQYKQDIERLM